MSAPDVVLLGIIPWDARWQRPHHFSAQLAARGHRVVYCMPELAGPGPAWARVSEATLPDGVVQVRLGSATGLQVNVSPRWPAEDLTAVATAFHTMLDDLAVRAPVLLVQSPAWWPFVEALLREVDVPVVYDCLDEHTGWFPENAVAWRRSEEALAARADLVLASAQLLHERMEDHAWHVVRVPNGCDVGHFTNADTPTGACPRVHDGPIVGYHGALGQWFDAQLVADLAELRPDWNLVLVGPFDAGVQAALDGLPNVVLVGAVPYHELPAYTADFDVAMIPFLVGDLSASTDPVKLWEYFAAAKPVVATPMLELHPFQGLLAIEEDAEGFAQAIDAYLRAPGDGVARRALAARASWGQRVDSFELQLRAVLPPVDAVVAGGDPGPALRDAGLTVQRVLEAEADDLGYAAAVALAGAGADLVLLLAGGARVATGGAELLLSRLQLDRAAPAVASREPGGATALLARRDALAAHGPHALLDAAPNVLGALWAA